MKKRSLAEAFQASLADDGAAGGSDSAARGGDDVADYMSDDMLAALAQTDAQRELTYSDRQRRAKNAAAARQHTEMRDADVRRAQRERLALEGEREARERGLATDLLAGASAGAALGAGTQAALDMMARMGYTTGSALGAQRDAAAVAPIVPDQRWLAVRGGATRLGIGHSALSLRIAAAASTEPAPPRPEQFRTALAAAAAEKHAAKVLVHARKTCRELDEAAGWAYSPLWLEPAALPPTHRLYAASPLADPYERGRDDAERLWAWACTDADGAPDGLPPLATRRLDAERWASMAVRAHTDAGGRALRGDTPVSARHVLLLRVLRAPVRQRRRAARRVPWRRRGRPLGTRSAGRRRRCAAVDVPRTAALT